VAKRTELQVSDQTNPGGAGDFRGSAADKRKDETVMVNADDLSNLVSSARQDPPAPAEQPAPAAAPAYQPPAAPAPAATSSGPPVALIAGILGVVAVIAVIFLVVAVL
jgi:hypothetical protein